MFGFFRRKHTPPAPPPSFEPRSTSLVPGDLVVCINDDWEQCSFILPGPHPVKDQVYRVTSVKMLNGPARHPSGVVFHPGPWIYLSLRSDCGYTPEHFRKAQLDHTPAEEEFTARIRDLIGEPAL